VRIISHSIVLTETSGWIAVWYLSSHGNFCIYLRMAVCMVFILKWEFLYFLRMAVWYLSSHGNFCIYLRMAVWYLSSHGNFYIFSGWLSGIYCLMGIFIFISGWLSSVYFHMGTFIFISRWLSGIYLHICLNLSPGGCLVFIFSWEYVYLYLDGCVVFLYFKTDKQLKTRKSLSFPYTPHLIGVFFFVSMLIIQLILKLLPKRGKHSIIPTIALNQESC